MSASIDRACPSCDADDYTLHDEYPAYRCLNCGALWQERMETNEAGEIVGISETIVLDEGAEL